MRRHAAVWLSVLVLAPVLALAAKNFGLADEPLPPDQAFGFTAEVTAPGTIVGTWEVADGYYLYHDKIQFSSNTPGITLGQPVIPPGKTKEDEFFGRVETHRGALPIEIPVERAANAPDTLELVAKSQGCADMGICYPPYETTVQVALPAAASGGSGGLGAVRELGRDLGLDSAVQEFLDPDQAFALSTAPEDGALQAHWAIADGYYLYKDKVQFRLREAPAGVSLGQDLLSSV